MTASSDCGSDHELMSHEGAASPHSKSSGHAHRRSEWWRSASVITGEVMGTGLLSLPYAISRLGWAIGLASSIGFGCTAIYSGVLLSYSKNELYPEAGSYADLAHATGGPRFGKFTRVSLAIGWGMILPYYLIACAASLHGAFPSLGLCYWQWSIVVMLCAAPTLQYRSLHGLSLLSLLSTLAIVIVVIVIVIGLIASAPTSAADGAEVVNHTSVGLPAGGSFLRVYSSLGAFIFAYQGQSMFLEVMREMQEPRDFPKALYAANGLMIIVYTGVSAIGYGTYGDRVQSFLPDTLPAGFARTVVGVLLAFHTLVSYLLTGQPLHRVLHLWLLPATADQPTRQGAWHWAWITLTLLVLAFLVANVVPFFADLQDLLGNLLGGASVFGWPAFFFLRGSKLKGRPVALVDKLMCALFLGVCLPAFTLVGTLNAFLVVVNDVQTNEARPFECSP